jgi:hypothetical protein
MTDFVYATGAGLLIAIVLLIIFGPPYYGYTLVYKPQVDSKGNNIEPSTSKKIGGWALMVGYPILLIVLMIFYMRRKSSSNSESTPLMETQTQ